MHYSYVIPTWFFGLDIGMEIFFALITISLAIIAFSIGRITHDRKTRLFAASFLLIGVSYFVLAFLNLWSAHLTSDGFEEIFINENQVLGMLFLHLYIILFIAGLVTLTYVKTDMKRGITYYLLMGLSLLVIASGSYHLLTLRILSIFLLSFIVYRYYEEYLENNRRKECWTTVAFLLLLISNIVFVLTPFYYVAYLIGHLFELISYCILFIILVKSVRK